ncbi:MAG: hypothetical protein K0S35_3453, partial [Geminicoccaceae bacterium]|nr:hypothetical protein [Geminicoccaceae bacterium]
MPDIDEVYQLAQPARVLYVVDNITTGEPWACIRVI